MGSLQQIAKRVLPDRAQLVLRHGIRKKRSFAAPTTLPFSHVPEAPTESPFSFMVPRDNDLARLGEKYNVSKRFHNYLPYYWLHFSQIRSEVRTVLEIGLQTDGSIRMWEEFFPNAMIYGVDIDPACSAFAGDRRQVLIGNQGDEAFLRRVVMEPGRGLDVVIDDGSHRVDHQLTSFNLLFPTMSDHGIYVIEDTGGCVGDSKLVTVKALQSLVESVMYWPRDHDPEDWRYLSDFPTGTRWRDQHIGGIAFYPYIAFIMRGKNPQDNPYRLTSSSA